MVRQPGAGVNEKTWRDGDDSMLRPHALLALTVLFAAAPLLSAQPSLPRVGGVDLPRLRAHCKQLLEQLARDAPLPADTLRKMRPLLEPAPGEEPAAVATAIQDLLDAHCLIGVNINPESRVKAARGDARAELPLDRPKVFLLKLHNEGGVTARLLLGGPQLRTPEQTGPGRWLEAEVEAVGGRGKGLSGDSVEYLILRLKGCEAGKREATLKFDVGQGTQDLGFRAEVPILFTVRARTP
jgi:hypothetical protein